MCALTSCDIETSDNGKLDGFWQVKSIENLTTGKVEDMRQSGRTWAFQGNILELRGTRGGLDILYSFEHKGNQLLLTNPYHIDRDNGDEALDDTEQLEPYGIYEPNTQFDIKKLDGSQMKLQSSYVVVTLRKY